MKKIFALFLALALLVPMGLVGVANAEGEVTAKPFYVLGWSDFDNEKYPYLEGLKWAQFICRGVKVSLNGVVYNEDGLDDALVTTVAKNLKAEMDKRPEGLRYWHLWSPRETMALKAEHVIYLDYGVDQMEVVTDAILKKYKEIGGQLDGIVIDTEYVGLASYYLSQEAAKDPLLYKKIVDDPRYATDIRPLLEERGFKFYHNVTDHTPEIYSADTKSGSEYAESRSIWDVVMRNHLTRYINQYAYGPLKTYFPEATLSDYQTIDSQSWLKLSTVTDSGETLTGGNLFKAGTTGAYSFYFAVPDYSFYQKLNKYASYNDAVYEGSPFNTLLYEINFAKHMFLSNDLREISPWIVHYDYKRHADMETSITIWNSAYYSEQIFHLGMLNPNPFLAYMYRQDNPINGDEAKFDERSNVLNELMAELTKVAGYSDRKAIDMAPYWNSEFILSGMYANGRNIWRITPNTDEVSLADFKVAGDDLTFAVKGQTITFPGGKIIEDGTITHVGTCGYWVETAKDVTPIITNDPNRFANYPSLIYDFEDAKEGKYDYNTHNPQGAWEFTWKKSTTTIEKVGDNKVLSINGTAELRSLLAGKITAGDTYAENQNWEVTVTIPEGLSAEAQIILLNYVGNQQKVKDGGFKIENGKLYYSTVGTDEAGKNIQEYKELMDIAPGTYTFKRAMDFNNAEAFTSGYSVYDASGKELASVKDIAVPVFANITSINFATKNITDKSVLLDDYKIIVTGVAADFELYDATHGMLVKDDVKDTPRTSSTAYRLSWLNAAAAEETATVMAAYYEGETLKEEKVIKEIKMAPGYDNVETGIVEVPAGQSVKVYLKLSNNNTNNSGATGNGDVTGSEDKGGIDTGLIVIITAAIVAVLAVVGALVATAPKKKADAPAEETEEASEAPAEETEAPAEETEEPKEEA